MELIDTIYEPQPASVKHIRKRGNHPQIFHSSIESLITAAEIQTMLTALK
jgi:hypothetical protein